MDFSAIELDDDLLALLDTIHGFVEKHLPVDELAERRVSGRGFDPVLHRELADRGWVLPELPVDQGGAGLDPIGRRLLDLELERAGAPMTTLNTTRHLLPTVRRFAEPRLASELVAGVAGGSALLCLGLTEAEAGSDVAGTQTTAERDGDHYLVCGHKPFVTSADVAQFCFMLARTDPVTARHRGLTAFLVPLDLPGVRITPVTWLSGERAFGVRFHDVRVPRQYRLGEEGAGWSVLGAVLDIEHGLGEETGGLSDRSFGEMFLRTIEHGLHRALDLAARPGADGVRPLDHPAVRAEFARMVLDIEAAGSAPGALGRVYGTEVTGRVARDLLDLVGPGGFLAPDGDDTADGLAEYLYRWSQGCALAGGTTEVVTTIIAARDLRLPRPPRTG